MALAEKEAEMDQISYSDKQINRADALLSEIDLLRVEAYGSLDPKKRFRFGQFSTSSSIARLMASMISQRARVFNILDPGAGIGSLSVALAAETCHWIRKPKLIKVKAYEIEPSLVKYLSMAYCTCNELCKNNGINFAFDIVQNDFIEEAVSIINSEFQPNDSRLFDCIILNPPYRKIRTESKERRLLKSIGIETSNLYTAFLWLSTKLLKPGGELVSITPRSFCNGPYFKPFRKAFFNSMTLNRIHAFESRAKAFHDDNVLQEIIIIHAIKSTNKTRRVITSSSIGPYDNRIRILEINHDLMVHPNDPYAVIHIIPDERAYIIKQLMNKLDSSLIDLDLDVSTGRVVDFRANERCLIRSKSSNDTFPLIYPAHISEGFVRWPIKSGKKPDSIIGAKEALDLLVPAGYYVLVKRTSSREEPRRIIAAVFNPNHVHAPMIGFENHLNYYHRNGKGIPMDLAKGLAAFLNSTFLDQYFRQFSGHTQVNVADLKSLKYPSNKMLVNLGTKIDEKFPKQDDLDQLVNDEIGISFMSK